jgi:uncharacterized membrane protein YqjE
VSDTRSTRSGDPPALAQAAQDLGRAGVESGRAAWDVLGAIRKLFAADLALSRSAFGLTLAWAGAAIALGASAWLLLMGLLVLVLHDALGMSWIAAMLLPALVSLLGAGLAGWRAARVFDDTRLNATRRQLARLGWGEDPAEVEREPERVA